MTWSCRALARTTGPTLNSRHRLKAGKGCSEASGQWLNMQSETGRRMQWQGVRCRQRRGALALASGWGLGEEALGSDEPILNGTSLVEKED
jgi:hypothetical protein